MNRRVERGIQTCLYPKANSGPQGTAAPKRGQERLFGLRSQGRPDSRGRCLAGEVSVFAGRYSGAEEPD